MVSAGHPDAGGGRDIGAAVVSAVKKGVRPTRRQVDARREQRERGDGLRDWLQRRAADLEKAAKKRAAKRAKKAAKAAKKADRNAEPVRTVEWVHQHAGHPYKPYVNPDRDKRSARSGRLRRELRP